uniref:Uncharacterized protein n=1 Tax=Oryza nivara TaxID=4536 RepID=A0A0E0I8R1_ORYNI
MEQSPPITGHGRRLPSAINHADIMHANDYQKLRLEETEASQNKNHIQSMDMLLFENLLKPTATLQGARVYLKNGRRLHSITDTESSTSESMARAAPDVNMAVEPYRNGMEATCQYKEVPNFPGYLPCQADDVSVVNGAKLPSRELGLEDVNWTHGNLISWPTLYGRLDLASRRAAPLLPTSLPDGGASPRPAASSQLQMRHLCSIGHTLRGIGNGNGGGRAAPSFSSGQINGALAAGPPWRAGFSSK